jgi:hypothetical protein
MGLKLSLRDPRRNISVSVSMLPGDTGVAWDMGTAVQALARKIASEENTTPMNVLFGSPPFEIVAEVTGGKNQ